MPVNPDIIFILLYFQKKVYRQSEPVNQKIDRFFVCLEIIKFECGSNLKYPSGISQGSTYILSCYIKAFGICYLAAQIVKILHFDNEPI